MTKPIKPIPTLYAGVRFRSRLEARWAVYFGELGVTWEYEPERFRLPDGRIYIPDFRLQGEILVEIKPPGGSFEKAEKFRGKILLLEGPPRVDSDNIYPVLHTGFCEFADCWTRAANGGMAIPPGCDHPDWAFIRWDERRRSLLFYSWGVGRDFVRSGQCAELADAASKALSERFGAHP